jgi:bifunctional non-homologous end joining protein LigD
MLLDERLLDLEEPGWIYEIKFDGYRVRAEFGEGVKTELRTRHGADATKWFPEVVKSLSSIKGGPIVTDGEVCVLDDLGRSDFERLQDRARRRRWFPGAAPVTYAVFDLLVDQGVDITQLPLIERKARLAKLLKAPPPNVLFVNHFYNEEHNVSDVFRDAMVPYELEGLVAKRADSVYVPGTRTTNWVKVKRKNSIPAQRCKRGPKSKDISIGL